MSILYKPRWRKKNFPDFNFNLKFKCLSNMLCSVLLLLSVSSLAVPCYDVTDVASCGVFVLKQQTSEQIMALAAALQVKATVKRGYGPEASDEPYLTSLVISESEVGDEGAAALAEAIRGSAKLQQLSLASCGVGAAGATAIAAQIRLSSPLKWLVMNGNPIGDAGATALARAMSSNTGITALFLTDAGCGDDGAVAFADAIKRNKGSALKELDLSSNEIGDVGANALLGVLPKAATLNELYLARNEKIGSAVLKTLSSTLKLKQAGGEL